MGVGSARRVHLPDLDALAPVIANLHSYEAIAIGRLRDDLDNSVRIVTNNQLDGYDPTRIIARTQEYIKFEPGLPVVMLIDFDKKRMPENVRRRIAELGGLQQALESVCPALAKAGYVMRPSTSAGLFNKETGERFDSSGGMHLYFEVADGADIDRALRVLQGLCWLAGLGWMIVSKRGSLLTRSLVDISVGTPERLVFEGPPDVLLPLMQDQAERTPIVRPGPRIDTRAALPDLITPQLAELKRLESAERQRLAPEMQKVREEYAATMSKTKGIPLAAARCIVGSQCNMVLMPQVTLEFDDGTTCTVGDVLANPSRYINQTLSDPNEGTEYGTIKAKVLLGHKDNRPFIKSFAHGGGIYKLRHDATTIEAAMRADPKAAADVLVDMLPHAEVNETEDDNLRGIACKLDPDTKRRPLNARIKTSQREHKRQLVAENQERRDAERTDRRVRLTAPFEDDEKIPVLRKLDEILGAVDGPEPPMRNLDGWPIEVRSRPPMPSLFHTLTAADTNSEIDPTTKRLPPPDLPLITLHDEYSMVMLVEQNVEYVKKIGDTFAAVSLHSTFIKAYMHYRGSTLPQIGAVVTMPMIMPDGSTLSKQGLDPERKIFVRIEPLLFDLIPKPEEYTRETVAKAMRYLIDEFLCDVATDFSGKCVLISSAMTIIERALLPERPGFVVSAGQRGNGKTTAVSMVIIAAIGRRPPAAAWSMQEDERRKSMMAYLLEGVPVIAWDNIPKGSVLSCPSIEKALTSPTYSDRRLGESKIAYDVSAITVPFFTGNNISAGGDLASRLLSVRLESDRPDPENRNFRHSDAIEWTLANRGEILRSMYTIMLGNPQLRRPTEDLTTRFKAWQRLVGSAIEHAASLAGETISFKQLFADSEGEDDEKIGLGQTLTTLRSLYGAGVDFQASQVTQAANPGDEATQSQRLRAAILRDFFETPSARGVGTLTPKSIGRRLKANVGTIVCVGDETLTLVLNKARGSKDGLWYNVHTTAQQRDMLSGMTKADATEAAMETTREAADWPEDWWAEWLEMIPAEITWTERQARAHRAAQRMAADGGRLAESHRHAEEAAELETQVRELRNMVVVMG
jgi:hypothetical protein